MVLQKLGSSNSTIDLNDGDHTETFEQGDDNTYEVRYGFKNVSSADGYIEETNSASIYNGGGSTAIADPYGLFSEARLVLSAPSNNDFQYDFGDADSGGIWLWGSQSGNSHNPRIEPGETHDTGWYSRPSLSEETVSYNGSNGNYDDINVTEYYRIPYEIVRS